MGNRRLGGSRAHIALPHFVFIPNPPIQRQQGKRVGGERQRGLPVPAIGLPAEAGGERVGLERCEGASQRRHLRLRPPIALWLRTGPNRRRRQARHQPLHAGFADDRGGNNHQLQAYGRGTNLHALWDSALFQQWPGGTAALKAVMEMAPGITISQAVVELNDGDIGSTQLLEDRLRIQRNKAISITEGLGLMVMEVARKTGGAGVEFLKDVVIDKAQLEKGKASSIANKKLISKIVGNDNASAADFPFDLADMVNGDEHKSWIAVIHADGNNLGQLIIEIVNACSDAGKAQNAIRNFSNILNATTISAAKAAYDQTYAKLKLIQ